MNNIETNPEFASEIVLSIPYCYYLQQRGELGQVVVCKGMKPFYYFADNVVEGFDYRSLDNEAALKDIPNKWLHNSEAGGRRAGVIDYSQWECPPYEEYYKNNLFDDLKPYVIVNNIYNIESTENNTEPQRYFDIKNLYDIFIYLTDSGYTVVYKRPENTEFTLDQNESYTTQTDIKLQADVDGIGLITDYELCDYFDGKVININDLTNGLDYSTLNLKLFAETEGFVSVNGGGYQLCACFDKPMVVYVTKGKETRPMYLEYEDSYIKMLSNAPIYPVYDFCYDWEENGGRNYDEIIKTVKEVF